MIKQSLTRIFLASSLIVFATFVFIPNSQAAACATSETTYSTYKVITFTSTGTCTWTAPTDISSGDILLIGGGGGGGGGAYGGGAGAGRILLIIKEKGARVNSSPFKKLLN